MFRLGVPRKRALRHLTSLALAVGFAVPVWGPGISGAQDSLPGIATAVPESAAVFHWTDLDRDGGQWQQTEALLARVGLPDALELWEETVLQDAGRDGGITSDDLDALLGGEMAVVVMPEAVEQFAASAMAGMESDTDFRAQNATPLAEGSNSPPGIVAILRPSNIDDAWSYAERQLGDAAAKMAIDLETGSIGSADVLILPPSPAESQGGEGYGSGADWRGGMHGYGMDGHGGIAAARAGDYIVAGHSETDLSDVIEVIEGNASSLADADEFGAVAALLPAEAISFTYIDGQGILDALDPEAVAMLQSAMVETPVEILGSQSGVAISADEPGFRFDTVTILNDTMDLDEFTVDNDPAIGGFAERVPAEVFVFQAGRLPANTFDGSAFALAQLVNAAEAGGSWPAEDDVAAMFPTDEEMAEQVAAASATLGFDLQTDLFDLLGDEFIAFSTFPALSLDSIGIDAVAAVSTTDPMVLAETMAKIAAWIDRSDVEVDINTEQADGAPVYVATSDEMAGTPGLEFGVIESQAVAAFGEGVEALTTSPEASLAEDEQYQTVMALLPSAYYQVGYVDFGKAIDPIFNMIGLITAFSEGGTDSFATPPANGEGVRNLRALGAVAYQEGNVSGASAILYIAD